MAQADYFLKIADVDGESTDSRHMGEIDVQSFSWGETHAGSPGQPGGAAGKVQPQDFQFVKRMDKSSPVLMISCATGQHFKSAVLSGRKAGAGQQDYLKITLDEVLMTSYQVGGATESDVVPTEQVSLAFARLEMSYKPQNPDGSLGTEVKQKFDFVADKKV